MTRSRLRGEDIAASVGPGWRSQGTNIGTGAVVKPDAHAAAKDWAINLGRKPSEKDRGNWTVQAQRLGISPEDEVSAWIQLTNQQKESGEHQAMKTLRKIFGDSIDEKWDGKWAGWQAPLAPQKRQVSPDDPERPEDANPNTGKRKTLPLGAPTPAEQDEATLMRGGAFLGYPKMNQAPQDGNAAGQAQTVSDVPPGFPFHTRSAERIWAFAQLAILTHPEAGPTEIIRLAIQDSEIPITDLTPEDVALLQMAVAWAQNGPPATSVRTGGTPGGPMRTSGGTGAP